MSGEDFDLNVDKEILGLASPRESVGGPYVVVYKNLEQRWAIVALDWDNEPRLGIRWFWGNAGNPFSSGHPTWFVVPSPLSRAVLSGLPLQHSFQRRVDDFLAGSISGGALSRHAT